jgi:hypothetical protein
MTILPPPVMPSGEEPMAAGGWHSTVGVPKHADPFAPPLVDLSDEEPGDCGRTARFRS